MVAWLLPFAGTATGPSADLVSAWGQAGAAPQAGADAAPPPVSHDGVPGVAGGRAPSGEGGSDGVTNAAPAEVPPPDEYSATTTVAAFVDDGTEPIRVTLGTPVGADLLADLGLPAVVHEVVAAVDRFVVRVEEEAAGAWDSWLTVAGLAGLAGELARRQLRRRAVARRALPGGYWGFGYGA